MINRLLLRVLPVLAGMSIAYGTPLQVSASETCTAFRAMGSSTYEVRKSVSSSGVTPGFRNNWDTDFIVPPGTRFTRYIATITSEIPENFNIIVHFKYADQTAQQVFRRDSVRLVGGIPFQIIGEPSDSARQPIQINTNIRARQGTNYRVSVSGCTQQ